MALSEVQAMELEARDLDVELCVRLGFESVIRGGTEWLSIPFVLGGKVVNHKYRTLGGEKKFQQDAEAVKCFWNEDVVDDPSLIGEPLIVTEGELDAVAAIQCGFLRTVSVPDGAPAKELGGATGAEDITKYSYVSKVTGRIPATTIIIIATDGDGPGMNLLNDLSLRFGKPRVKFLTYPKTRDGSRRLKDLNEVLQYYGKQGVIETISRAKWIAEPGVYAMSERPQRPDREKYSLHMGEDMDRLAKLRRGDFWVITGIPGHGKSALVDDMLCRIAYHEGLRICYASFEKDPVTDHRRDLRKWFIGHQRGHSGGETWTRDEFAQADEFIERCFRFVVPSDSTDASLEWLCEQFEAAVVQKGCDVCVIDPWNEIEHNRAGHESLTDYTGYAIKRLKRMARFLDVPVITVAHPSKGMAHDLTLHSISDSAHWANKCDVGILVGRDFDEGTVKIALAKVRNDDIGKVGKLRGFFDVVTRHFHLNTAGT